MCIVVDASEAASAPAWLSFQLLPVWQYGHVDQRVRLSARGLPISVPQLR